VNIKEFRIDRYGPLGSIEKECNGEVEVFYGPNESGKTLLVEGLLKFMHPEVRGRYDRMQRVEESPSGYLVMETEDGVEKLEDGTRLDDISDIGPNHLRNLFTVRDSDLSFYEQHSFYNSLTEQIGELHTSEIEAIRDEFVDRGRITSKRRNISNSSKYDKAGDQLEDAVDLAEDIEGYVEKAEDENLDDLERELIEKKAELEEVREELEEQERAEAVSEYNRLSKQLSRYEKAAEKLNDRYEFTQDELEELQKQEKEISDSEEEVEEEKNKIDDLEPELEGLNDEQEEAKKEKLRLERREDDVNGLRGGLNRFREDKKAEDLEDRSATARKVSIVSLAGGAVTGASGAFFGQSSFLLPSLILVVVGAAALVYWYTAKGSASDLKRREESLIEDARDLGFEVEEVSDIAPEIQRYDEDLKQARNRVNNLKEKVSRKGQALEKAEDDLKEAKEAIRKAEERKEEILEEAGVEDADEYRSALDSKSEIDKKKGKAEQSLRDAFEEPEDYDGTAELVSYWETELEGMVEDLDVDKIDEEEYDEDRLDTLQEREEELEDAIEGLEGDLNAHRDKIDKFNERARDIRTDPFIDWEVSLRSESVDGLKELREDLLRFGDTLEKDAEISRVGLDVFDEIHEEEEEKMTSLFERDGRASEVFHRITQGQYESVSYDPESKELVVEDLSGVSHTPEDLSHGTREQLYFSTRVSLAEQLLSGEPGFFVLDDAFLPSDKRRLREGFEVLEELTDEGWQILYMTAKQEVGENIVEEFDLPQHELPPLR
jgi:DNA repair exonuclease SbcCD ATPase subunit